MHSLKILLILSGNFEWAYDTALTNNIYMKPADEFQGFAFLIDPLLLSLPRKSRYWLELEP